MYGTTFNLSTCCLLRGYLPRLVLLASLSLALSTSTAFAQYCTPDQCDECNLCRCSQRCCHELPELWLVNTRCAPRCKNLDCGFDRLIYKRYDRHCCRWVRESRETFLAQEATMPSLFYVHGNSLNHKYAMKGCWQIYCKMRCCPGKKRLVFWSWPAERVFKTKGLRIGEMIEKNLRIKYVYAEYQGYYMAKLVNQMSLTQRVMMSGHSYGGITSSAAMHYLGGGCLRGLTLAGGAAVEHPNLRAAVISGAFDHDMLNPGNRYGQAFVAAEKIFVTRNIKDRTLKKWPKTSWRGRRAIGVLGVNANCLGVYRNKLCQKTMTSDVGTSHYLKPHLKSVNFVSALCCLSFPQCQNCSVAATTAPIDAEVMPVAAEDVPSSLGSNNLNLVGLDPAGSDPAAYDPAAFDLVGLDSTDFEVDEVDEEQTSREIEMLTDQQLDSDESLLASECYTFDEEQLELDFVETLINDSNDFNPTCLAATNGSDAFRSIETGAPDSTAIYSCQTTLADLTQPAAAVRQVNSVAKASTPIASNTRAIVATVEPTPQQVAPSQAKLQAAETLQVPTAQVSRHSIWYQCGLCLAIVLTGQFYVFFSKRSTPS